MTNTFETVWFDALPQYVGKKAIVVTDFPFDFKFQQAEDLYGILEVNIEDILRIKGCSTCERSDALVIYSGDDEPKEAEWEYVDAFIQKYCEEYGFDEEDFEEDCEFEFCEDGDGEIEFEEEEDSESDCLDALGHFIDLTQQYIDDVESDVGYKVEKLKEGLGDELQCTLANIEMALESCKKLMEKYPDHVVTY